MGDDAGNALSRRQFGQWLGAAALAGALPEMSRAMPSDERVPRGPAHDETSAIGPHVTGDEICDLVIGNFLPLHGRCHRFANLSAKFVNASVPSPGAGGANAEQ